jgi:hypothetical protein
LRGLISCLFVTGCTFHSPTTADGTTAPDGDGGGEVGLEKPPGFDCLAKWKDHSVMLTSPAPVGINSAEEDRDPYISNDELTLYFGSNRAGSQMGDVYVAHRLAVGDNFDIPVIATDISSTDADSRVSMTSSELVMVQASHRSAGGQGASDIWQSSRTDTASLFGPFTEAGLTAVDDNTEQLDPEISANGLRLYLAVSAFPQHIAVSERASVGDPFSAPTSFIDSTDGDSDPSLSPDELVIVFSSNRVGTGMAGGNIWYTTRASIGAALEGPFAVPAVNSPSNDGDPTLSRDGCHLYFASDRGIASYDLYVSEVMP